MQKISVFFSLLLFIGCSNDNFLEQANTYAEAVKKQFVPDRRVAIFDYELKKTKAGLLVKGETNLPAAKDSLWARLENSKLSLIDSFNVLPAANLNGKEYGVVRLSVSNIRSKPKHSAELATQATLGTPLRVYKKQGDWYYIQTPDGYLGWLDKDGFSLFNKTEYATWQKAEKIIVTADYGKVRSAAQAEAEVVSDVLSGNILKKVKTENTFTQVEFPDGRQAWLNREQHEDFATWLQTTQADTSSVFKAARRMLGSPYLWGGTSTKGMDCSGYTKTIFFENGILLPRDASQQVHIGQEIETDTTLRNLIPGDLIFFGRKANAEQRERIWHVAIYMGAGKIIHSAGNVKIQSLRRGDVDFAEDRLLTMVRAKRILGSEGKNGVQLLKKTDVYRHSTSN